MNEERHNEVDPVENLLKHGGRREQVSKERFDRVEKQAFEHWQRAVEVNRFQERGRKRRVVVARLAMAASVVLAVILLPKILAPAPLVADVIATVGIVESGARGEPMTRTVVDAQIRAGGFIETGAGGGAALALASGHSLRIDAQSRVRIEETAVILDRGRIYLDSGATGKSTPITVQSVYATVRELGTQYQVRLLQDGMQVSVREGQVRLEVEDTTYAARAGEILTLDAAAAVERSDIAAYGEHWSWTSTLIATIAIDGKTVDEVLQWLSREHGWQIRYASVTLQEDAMAIRVNGSIEGLEAEDALRSVLASVGWQYSLADGVVQVSNDTTEPAQ